MTLPLAREEAEVNSTEDLLRHALECERLAEKMSSPAARHSAISAAAQWRKLADEDEAQKRSRFGNRERRSGGHF
jgi:hypothetical protein